MSKKLLRICTQGCEYLHYENCPECFGYGLRIGSNGHRVPLTAGKAELVRNGELDVKVVECRYCNSLEYGLGKPAPSSNG